MIGEAKVSGCNCSNVNVNEPHWLFVNFGSGNDLVPLGSKSLTEPMLNQIHVAICRR